MKRAVVLLLLASCAPNETPSAAERLPRLAAEEILVASKPSIDPLLLKTGQWILLSVSAKGDARNYLTKIQATAVEERAVWVEQRVPGEKHPVVFKSKIARDGTLLEAWVGEPRSTSPVKAYPKEGAVPAPRSATPPVDATSSRETITVRDRVYDCTKLVTTLPHPDGTTSTVTEWCSPAVPFSALHDGKPVGGLVRREFDRYRVELVDSGEGAVEELPLPK